MEDKLIKYDSQESAQIKTVTGWVSSKGFFFGEGDRNEHLARYNGCDLIPCDGCGKYKDVHGYCYPCHEKNMNEKFKKLKSVEWDLATPICIFNSDIYFFDEDGLEMHCYDEGVDPASLQLVLCEPNYPKEIDLDELYCDDLPEEQTVEEIFPELAAIIAQANKLIWEKKKPLSWGESNIAATLPAAVIEYIRQSVVPLGEQPDSEG